MAAKAVGAKGFKAVWTEIEGTATDPGQCRGFVCRDRGYCIDEKLKCNGANNCGGTYFTDDETFVPDLSDEADCKLRGRYVGLIYFQI